MRNTFRNITIKKYYYTTCANVLCERKYYIKPFSCLLQWRVINCIIAVWRNTDSRKYFLEIHEEINEIRIAVE